VVLCARPGIGAITLALLFGLFNLIAGTWMLAAGTELRRTGKTLDPSVRQTAAALSQAAGGRQDGDVACTPAAALRESSS
jgi:hypothetical protein